MDDCKNIDKMRPIELHNNVILAREKSGVEFFLAESSKFHKRVCPGCGNEDAQKVFIKYGFIHNECNHCSTLFVSPCPSEEQLFKYYRDYVTPNFWTEVLINTNDERKYLQHLPRVKKLKKILDLHDNKKEKFIDIGAGNGNFAKAVQESNIFINVVAADISDKCVDSCKKQGLETVYGSIDVFENSSIDCITFNDLIEHIFDPYGFLIECNNKLRENGLLMLSTPNGEGFDFKILKEKTENITPPEHIQYFNLESIQMLLKRAGFEVVDISTPGILDVEIIKRQRDTKKFDLASDNAYLDYILSLDSDVLKSFQNFLQDNLLSSHMLVFAIKK